MDQLGRKLEPRFKELGLFSVLEGRGSGEGQGGFDGGFQGVFFVVQGRCEGLEFWGEFAFVGCGYGGEVVGEVGHFVFSLSFLWGGFLGG